MHSQEDEFKRSEHTGQKVCQFCPLWLDQLLGGCIKNTSSYTATGLWHNVSGRDSQSLFAVVAYSQSAKRGYIGILGWTETEPHAHSI